MPLFNCIIMVNIAYLQVFDSPGSSLMSQNSILGFVERTVIPLSPLLGTNDVSHAVVETSSVDS